jgi:predicted phage-related endonuclease
MEKFIGELFAEKKDVRLSESKELWRHKDVAWATASPDFYIIEGEIIEQGFQENVTGLVECKNVNYRQLNKWLDDNIPDSYYLQTVWQLGVLGLQQGFLAGLVGASPDDFFTPEVKFSAPLFNQLLDLGNKFMLNVKQDIPPQAGAGDLKLLEKITNRNLSEAIILPDTLESDLAELEMIKKEKSGINKSLKNLEDDEKRLKAKVIQKMGTATTAMLGDYTVNLNHIHRSAQEATDYWTFNLKKAR